MYTYEYFMQGNFDEFDESVQFVKFKFVKLLLIKHLYEWKHCKMKI